MAAGTVEPKLSTQTIGVNKRVKRQSTPYVLPTVVAGVQ